MCRVSQVNVNLGKKYSPTTTPLMNDKKNTYEIF
jgi:hypothetical protein